jgi:hypothetical protein
VSEHVVSSDSSADMGGKMPGQSAASTVLPDPGPPRVNAISVAVTEQVDSSGQTATVTKVKQAFRTYLPVGSRGCCLTPGGFVSGSDEALFRLSDRECIKGALGVHKRHLSVAPRRDHP